MRFFHRETSDVGAGQVRSLYPSVRLIYPSVRPFHPSVCAVNEDESG